MATKPENQRPNRKPRAKQGWIEGMAPPSIPEIDEAASRYVGIRDERMRLTEEETTKKDMLLELMKKHKLKVYDFDGFQVFLVPGDVTVKVKRKKQPAAEGQEESNGEAE